MLKLKNIVYLMILVVLLLFIIPNTVFSSELKIADDLQEVIDSADEHINVLIYMNKQADTDEIYAGKASSLEEQGNYKEAKSLVRSEIVNSLRETADISQASILRFLETMKAEGKVSSLESFFIVNIISVSLDPSLAETIAARPDVGKIYQDRTIVLDDPLPKELVSLPDEVTGPWSISSIRAPEAWDKHGYDGTGVVIGIIDTGALLNHPALETRWRGYDTLNPVPNYNWYDPIYGDPLPGDEHGHGTKVLGVALGYDQQKDLAVGVAPGAKWIAARGFSNDGRGSKSNLLAAGQYMLAPTDTNGENPDPTKAPNIVLNSWGGQAEVDDWFREMVNNWRNAFILPIFAAGNSGPGVGSVRNPANYPESIAVGAVDYNRELASFSSRGPGAYGDMIKPELIAPGVNIYCPTLDGDYGYASGTSFAAPHVAGTAALLLSAYPELTVNEIVFYLKETAISLSNEQYPTIPNYGFGYGMTDALNLIEKSKVVPAIYFQNLDSGQIDAWLIKGLSNVEQVDSFTGKNPKLWRIAAVHDLNGSGSPDLIWENRANGSRVVWLMEVFEKKEEINLGYANPNYRIADIYDLNNNGSADLVWQNIAWGSRNAWYMDGLKRISGRQFAVVNTNWEIAGVADMGGDGKINLIWEHGLRGERNYWTLDNNLAQIVQESGNFAVAGINWRIKAVIDINWDGNPDLVWEHADGRRSIWFMSGLDKEYGALFGSRHPDWTIVGAERVAIPIEY